MLRSRGSKLVCLCIFLELGACAVEEQFVELNFPSETTFVRSASAIVVATPLTAGREGECPELIRQAELGVLTSGELAANTGLQSVCDFRNGLVRIPEVPEGLLAYIAVATSEIGQPLLAGCKVSDVYQEGGPLRIVLSPTATYRSLFMAGSPAAQCTVDSKCGEGCSER